MGKGIVAGMMILLCCFEGWSQPAASWYGDATAAVGRYEGTLSIAGFHDWPVAFHGNFAVGVGSRATAYLGQNRYYITAPAKLTSGEKGPQVIFKENIEANIDTFLVRWSQVDALNVAVNLSYRISPRVKAGFNIDVIGFSLGSKVKGNYINGYYGKRGDGSPTAFNLLLVSDNDRGTLNSEFYLKYDAGRGWGFKGGAQFLFTEYTTDDALQQLPEPNNRFRKKSLMVCLGVTHAVGIFKQR